MPGDVSQVFERFGRQPACDARAIWEMWRRDVRIAVRFENLTKTPAAGFPARAIFDPCDAEYVPVICPTCQTLLPTSRVSASAGCSRLVQFHRVPDVASA